MYRPAINYHLLRPFSLLRELARSQKLGMEAFENSLNHQILLSERLRALVVGSVTGVFLGFFLLMETFSALSSLDMQRIAPTLNLVLGGLSAYEFLVFGIISRAIRRNRDIPHVFRFLNTTLEITAPSVLIWVGAEIYGPFIALSMPAPFGYFLFILASTLRLDIWIPVYTGMLAALEYLGLVWWFSRQGTPENLPPALTTLTLHIDKAALLALAGIIAALVSREVRRRMEATVSTLKERDYVVSVFGQHVSPAVVDQLLVHKEEMNSANRYVCVMFLDIRNFTTFSERRTPEEVVTYLNTLFEFMIDAVNRHQGIINKFLGDGFMAVFGAPLPDALECRHAVDAALEIIARLEPMAAQGLIPVTRVGIGLHAGEATTGNIGSSARKEYTLIGDVVNLASRIESLNKEFNSNLLVSEPVWQAIGGPTFGGEALGPAKVKGREEAVQVFKLA